MSLRAVGKKVIILQNSAEETTASGLVIPDAAQEKPHQGIVWSITDEASEETDVFTGMTVIFPRYGSTHVTDEGRDFVICETKDILAVVTE